MYPWSSEDRRIGGIGLDDKEPHLEAKVGNLDLHGDCALNCRSMVVEATYHNVGRF